MNQTQAYISIDDPIYGYVDEAEMSEHRYFKLFNIAIRGMEELGLDFFYTIRSVKLPVNSNKTVFLPDDFLMESKVGVLNDRGEVIVLKQNNKLTTYADLNTNRKSKTEDNTLWDQFWFNSPTFWNWWNGYLFQNVYGFPSGAPFLGSFKFDKTNGVLLLNEDFFYDYIILEYVAAPAPKKGSYFIPVQFREALISYLRWKDIISLPNSRRGGLGDKRDRRHEYFNDRRLAIARWKPIQKEQAHIESMESNRLTIKI